MRQRMTDDERYDAQREREIEAAIAQAEAEHAELLASIKRALPDGPIEAMAQTDTDTEHGCAGRA